MTPHDVVGLSPEQIVGVLKAGAELQQLPLTAAEKRAVMQLNIANAKILPQEMQLRQNELANRQSQFGSEMDLRNRTLAEQTREHNQSLALRQKELEADTVYKGNMLQVHAFTLLKQLQSEERIAKDAGTREDLQNQQAEVHNLVEIMTTIRTSHSGQVYDSKTGVMTTSFNLQELKKSDPEAYATYMAAQQRLSDIESKHSAARDNKGTNKGAASNLAPIDNLLKGKPPKQYKINGKWYNWDGQHAYEAKEQ